MIKLLLLAVLIFNGKIIFLTMYMYIESDVRNI